MDNLGRNARIKPAVCRLLHWCSRYAVVLVELSVSCGLGVVVSSVWWNYAAVMLWWCPRYGVLLLLVAVYRRLSGVQKL